MFQTLNYAALDLAEEENCFGFLFMSEVNFLDIEVYLK